MDPKMGMELRNNKFKEAIRKIWKKLLQDAPKLDVSIKKL